MLYHVRHALHEESKEGWIWVFPDPGGSGPHVRLKRLEPIRTIVTEIRVIDSNFRFRYSNSDRTRSLPDGEAIIVINEHYRDKLKIGDAELMELDIVRLRSPFAGMISGIQHPQTVVRTATWLGVLSLALGILSLLIAVLLH